MTRPSIYDAPLTPRTPLRDRLRDAVLSALARVVWWAVEAIERREGRG